MATDQKVGGSNPLAHVDEKVEVTWRIKDFGFFIHKILVESAGHAKGKICMVHDLRGRKGNYGRNNIRKQSEKNCGYQ